MTKIQRFLTSIGNVRKVGGGRRFPRNDGGVNPTTGLCGIRGLIMDFKEPVFDRCTENRVYLDTGFCIFGVFSSGGAGGSSRKKLGFLPPRKEVSAVKSMFNCCHIKGPAQDISMSNCSHIHVGLTATTSTEKCIRYGFACFRNNGPATNASLFTVHPCVFGESNDGKQASNVCAVHNAH